MSGQHAIVVGAGVFGAWTSLELARAGWSVNVIDQFAPGNIRASSGGESRTIRFAHGGDGLLTAWATESSALWEEVNEQWHEPLLVRTGAAWLIDPSDDHSWEERSAEVLTDHGIAHRWLDAQDVSRRYPGLRVSGYSHALFECDAGLLYARRGVRALMALAQHYDVRITRCHATPEDRRVRLEDGTMLDADVVVWACGPWLAKQFIDLPVAALKQDVYYLGGPCRGLAELPPWLDRTRMTYGSGDLAGRGVKVNCDRWATPIDVDDEPREAAVDTLTEIRTFLTERFPDLADLPLITSEVCQYEMTPDGDFLISAIPNTPGWWVVGGGSGQGYKHAPMVAREVVSQIQGRSPDKRFRLDRPTFRNPRTSVFG